MKDLNVLTTPVGCPIAYSYISFLFVRNSILMVSSKKKLQPDTQTNLRCDSDKICLPLFALLDILNSIIPSFGLHKRIQYLCILFLSAQRALLLFPQEVQYKFDEKYKAANHITWH